MTTSFHVCRRVTSWKQVSDTAQRAAEQPRAVALRCILPSVYGRLPAIVRVRPRAAGENNPMSLRNGLESGGVLLDGSTTFLLRAEPHGEPARGRRTRLCRRRRRRWKLELCSRGGKVKRGRTELREWRRDADGASDDDDDDCCMPGAASARTLVV